MIALVMIALVIIALVMIALVIIALVIIALVIIDPVESRILILLSHHPRLKIGALVLALLVLPARLA